MIRLYFKVARSNFSSIAIYLCIFSFIFVFYSMSTKSDNNTNAYVEEKESIAIMDYDQSETSKELISYLESTMDVPSSIGDTLEEKKDAMFYGQISSIVEIPEDFESVYNQDMDTDIKVLERENSANGIILKQKVSTFLNNASMLMKTDSSLNMHEASLLVQKNLSSKADMVMQIDDNQDKLNAFRNSFFNYASYILMAIIIMVVGMAMMNIYQVEIMRRNLIAPVSSTKMNIQLIFANIIFGSIIWAILSCLIIFLCKENMFNVNGAMYLLNLYIFTIVCITISFFISSLLFNKQSGMGALNAIVNILSLGSAFLCGAFVPQAMIGENILRFAQFLPSYWYIKTSDMLTASFDETLLKESLCNMGIMALFGVVFVLLALYVMKQKRSQDSFLSSGDVE